jgi:hypothetical protein
MKGFSLIAAALATARGLVISRVVNEFGIARTVAATIEEAFGARPAGWHRAEPFTGSGYAERNPASPRTGLTAPRLIDRALSPESRD